ncbi:LacI family DNA-binding transcriptional regulator [Schleiferilactobacillus harbinensis]|uniref:LacI family DNA-binding transcriptional regulator n=1 Tax=Schleiferilactobacillus harbinensis TaxID=304207 RepID=UPI001AAF5136|nr:LacI family DNA-binding transcriptional regulator [Schleiferilactobacillus harbinensis]MBO3093004.1 LacI family DNA-binding transcriptional regulator [Schleiferilactobacillus harbinensis]
MATIKQIAQAAGFSPTTVSRILNNDNSLSVTQETREKVLQAANSLGYGRDQIPRVPYRMAVFFWITAQEELDDVYFNTLKRSLQFYGKTYGLSLEFFEKGQLDAAQVADFDGFIAVGAFNQTERAILEQISNNGVFIDSNPRIGHFNSVQPDFEQIISEALALCQTAGMTKVGFIGGQYLNPDTNQFEPDSRENIFRNYASRAGLLDEKLIHAHDSFSVTTGQVLGKQIAENTSACPLPNAFIVAADPIAVGVLQAFSAAGILVPRDTSLLSINNIQMAKYTSPPLSTFAINQDELCRAALARLIDIMENPEKQIYQRTLVSAYLVARGSFVINQAN